MTPADVDRVLKHVAGNKLKLDIVKDEVRYLKSVLGVVSKRLVFGKKDLETLVSDLKAVLEMSREVIDSVDLASASGALTDTGIEVDVDVHESGEKRKRSSESVDKHKKQRTTMKPDTLSSSIGCPAVTYTFKAQGEWVAVAYETEWFIGSVVDVISAERADIQFLSRGHQNIYRWPRVDDIDTVDKRFVFANGFDVSTSNGRTWSVPEWDYLQDLYKSYCSMYFVDSLEL